MSARRRSGPISILAASAGLGTYSPAVELYQYLVTQGNHPVFDVLESNFTHERQSRTLKARQKWQDNFQLALMAQRFLSIDDIGKDLDAKQVSLLFARWRQAAVSRFVLFSGFWLPILQRYLTESNIHADVECLQMDSVLGHSWSRYLPEFTKGFSLRWLFSAEDNSAYRTIVPPKLRHGYRPNSVVMHGGGWQIGDYSASVLDLERAGYVVTAGVHNLSQSISISGTRFCVDPAWLPWSRGVPQLTPHLVMTGRDGRWKRAGSRWFADSLQFSIAIVSKPGGATLLDSLTFAIPLVFCEPYGDVEEQNADLWIRKGFGMHISDWKKSGYHRDALEDLRSNLSKQQQALDLSFAESLNAE